MKSNLLRAKMKENGKTQMEVANEIGISANSLSRKISGKGDFKLSEVELLCQSLKIENPCDIFFA